MSNKTRLDVLLVERGFAPTRQKAQAIIMAGSVFVADQSPSHNIFHPPTNYLLL